MDTGKSGSLGMLAVSEVHMQPWLTFERSIVSTELCCLKEGVLVALESSDDLFSTALVPEFRAQQVQFSSTRPTGSECRFQIAFFTWASASADQCSYWTAIKKTVKQTFLPFLERRRAGQRVQPSQHESCADMQGQGICPEQGVILAVASSYVY